MNSRSRAESTVRYSWTWVEDGRVCLTITWHSVDKAQAMSVKCLFQSPIEQTETKHKSANKQWPSYDNQERKKKIHV